jgi:hypothetical protein
MPPAHRRLVPILLLTFASSCFLAGCAMQSALQPVHLKGFIFRNQTSGVISSIEVKVPKTDEVASCTNIPPGSSCSNRFPLRRYQGNPLTLSWRSAEKVFVIEDLVIRRPEKLVHGEPATAILTFGNNGSISTELIQGTN